MQMILPFESTNSRHGLTWINYLTCAPINIDTQMKRGHNRA